MFDGDNVTVSIQVEKSKQEYMEEGTNVEKYISSTVCDKNCIDVTRNNDYPGVDFLIYDGELDVKNSWNTENWGNKKLRESRNIKIWYRKNKNGSCNWHTFPYKSNLLSENGFRSFTNQEHIPTLESCFG